MARVRCATSRAISSWLTGSMATQTQRGARPALQRLLFAPLARLTLSEQSEELIELDLSERDIVEPVLRKGGELLSDCAPPVKHRVRINLEHPCHGANTQPLSQGGQHAHERCGGHALALERRAPGFLQGGATGNTLQLPPGTATRMPIRLEIPTSHPPLIGTGCRETV